MGKKKKKEKKISAKKLRYAQFRKEKPATIDLTMPDLTPEQQKEKQVAEEQINKFLRFNRNRPPNEVVERRAKSKR